MLLNQMIDLYVILIQDCYGGIAPRSGIATKNGIDVGAGVIDSDYTGNVAVLLFNFGDKEFTIKKGDKIAQLICEQIIIPNLTKVTKLKETKRGMKGFGSSD